MEFSNSTWGAIVWKTVVLWSFQLDLCQFSYCVDYTTAVIDLFDK